MNLESLGFPVRLYSEMDTAQFATPTLEAFTVNGEATAMQAADASLTSSVRATASAPKEDPVIQKVEKQAKAHEDPLSQLIDQVPQPCADKGATNHLAFEACALLTR